MATTESDIDRELTENRAFMDHLAARHPWLEDAARATVDDDLPELTVTTETTVTQAGPSDEEILPRFISEVAVRRAQRTGRGVVGVSRIFEIGANATSEVHEIAIQGLDLIKEYFGLRFALRSEQAYGHTYLYLPVGQNQPGEAALFYKHTAQAASQKAKDLVVSGAARGVQYPNIRDSFVHWHTLYALDVTESGEPELDNELPTVSQMRRGEHFSPKLEEVDEAVVKKLRETHRSATAPRPVGGRLAPHRRR